MRLPGPFRALLRPIVERGRRAAQRISQWIRPWQPWTGEHHPVLADLEPWSGETDGTWVYDSIGVRTDPRYRPQFRPQPRGRIETKHPSPYAPYFELVFVLEAVKAAKPGQAFEMVELGAGYGAWLATASKAAERFGIRDVRLTGLEMVPEHVAWMKEHLRNNGADPDEHRILHGAVSDVDGEVVFLPDAEADFGQRISRRGAGVRVPSWSLASLLKDQPRVSLIHCDIQGEEGRVFRAAVDLVQQKVERLLISTHSNSIHRDLRSRLLAAGFEVVYDFPVRSRARTEYGDVQFLDGLLCLINSRLALR
jgi:FkbM family methyltransferase